TDTSILVDHPAIEAALVRSASKVSVSGQSMVFDNGQDGFIEVPRRPMTADPTKSARERDAKTVKVPSSRVSRNSDAKRVRKRSKKSEDAASKAVKPRREKVTVEDFDIMRVLGKGCAGKVRLFSLG